jgi:meiotically up-regulated gene 157 (Mug157) protein
MSLLTRRDLLRLGATSGIGAVLQQRAFAGSPLPYPSRRPAPGDRRFVSVAVEGTIQTAQRRIGDQKTAWLFGNCFPNTLDTTVHFEETTAGPDTFVITGDIDAMWLRDSSAQVWPYLPLMRRDKPLQRLIAGVIRRQTHCILLDPYANAFLADPNGTSEWKSDYTVMKPGIHERKWEIDSLCYSIRLAYAYWKATGDVAPFDVSWERAMDQIVQTFREQQRKEDNGPYAWQRGGPRPEPGSPASYGSPVGPIGLICSRFRPSDDETRYQFLIPSNFFAVTALRQMAILLDRVRHKQEKAKRATAFADEVSAVLRQHATQKHPKLGTVYAYEIDGLGHVSLMDDANVPSLLSMPYLGLCKTSDPVYQATRRLVWSPENPQFYEGKYRGIGGHVGPDMIWPMALILYGLTSTSPEEIAACLRTLRDTDADTGFMHEAFHKDDSRRYTRSWFAWANTLFGEFVLHTLYHHSKLLM